LRLHRAQKAEAFDEDVTDEVVLTADTIVAIDGLILGKPESSEHAVEMLQRLSGKYTRFIPAFACCTNTNTINFTTGARCFSAS
jgi:predicted house-cleaning NTP pyrophosphatase (Maf/HAM1 superfamily)